MNLVMFHAKLAVIKKREIVFKNYGQKSVEPNIYIEQETLQKDTIDGLGLYDTL